MPSLFPLLVESIIDWYKWYIRWSEVSGEYRKTYYVREDMWDWNYTSNEYDSIKISEPILIFCNKDDIQKKRYNYRSNGAYGYIFSRDGKDIKWIPRAYHYSSGFINIYGYNDTIKFSDYFD